MVGARHTVLVTGATGFVGRHLVERLVRDGYEVVAGSRSAAKQATSFPAGVRTVTLDITDPATLGPALEHVDIVVHAAAKTGDWGRPREFERVLRDGTQHLLDACVRHRLSRFVHLSSAIFYGTTGRGAMTEGMLPGHSHLPYGEGKIAAEHAVKQAREQHGLPTVILRPANIFGPGSRLWTDRPARLIEQGLMSLPLDYGKANPVFIENVVEAVCTVCRHDGAIGDTFNVTDDDQLTWRDFFGAYAAALGKGEIALRAPWMLYGLASSLETLASVTGRPPLLTRHAVTHLRFQGTYAPSRLAERLGYRPVVGIQEALRRTADYLRDRTSA
jgi:nucleoside-diphosphate-sugar epimerase